MINNYIMELQSIYSTINFADIITICDTIQKSEKVYIIGNGGSYATSEHFVVDLIKYSKKQAHCLSNMSFLTMCSNDYRYHIGAYYFLRTFATKQDCLICLSTSGISKNIITILQSNVTKNTILITGNKNVQKINTIKNIKHCLVIPSTKVQIIEDITLSICHIISMELERRVEL